MLRDCASRNATTERSTLIPLVYENCTQKYFSSTYSVVEGYFFIKCATTLPLKTIRLAATVAEWKIRRIMGAWLLPRWVTNHLSRYGFNMRRSCDQWIRERSHTRHIPSTVPSVYPQQTNSTDDSHNIRHARAAPTSSISTIQTEVAPSLQASTSVRTVVRHLSERYLASTFPLRILPMKPAHRRHRLERYGSRRHWTARERNQVVICDESRFNMCSDVNRVRLWRSLV